MRSLHSAIAQMNPVGSVTEPWAAADHWAAHDCAVWVAQSGHRLIEFEVTIASPDDGTVLSGSPFLVTETGNRSSSLGDSATFATPEPSSSSASRARGHCTNYGPRPAGGPTSIGADGAGEHTGKMHCCKQVSSGSASSADSAVSPAAPTYRLRRVTDGALIRSYSDSLCVARIEGRIDWPVMLAQHPTTYGSSSTRRWTLAATYGHGTPRPTTLSERFRHSRTSHR